MKDRSFVEFVLEQLAELPDVSCRRMFGGYGLYAGEIFFGIIHKDVLYFKTSEATRGDYIAAGAKQFRPSAKQTLKSYYEVPADMLEDRRELVEWAGRAIES